MRPRTFASLAVVTALACHEGPTTPSAAGGLTLALALARTELQRGEPDTITMTLTNSNAYPVSLSGDVCEPRPYITDAHGVTVLPSGGDWFCIDVLIRLTLAAGERQTRTFAWLTSAFSSGTYSVYATFTAHEVRLATQPTSVRLN